MADFSKKLKKGRVKNHNVSTCPQNEYLITRLKEYIDKISSSEQGQRLKYTINQAIKSIYKYPLPIISREIALQLEHIGPFLSNQIHTFLLEKEKYLLFHQESETSETSITQISSLPTQQSNISTNKISPQNKSSSKSQVNNKSYIPKYRSGGYAILLSLYLQSLSDQYPGYCTKNEIIENSIPYCNSSFEQKASSHYSAWSSMKTLIDLITSLDKKYVNKYGKPSKYYLSETGKNIAIQLNQTISTSHLSTTTHIDSNISNSTSSPSPLSFFINPSITKQLSVIPSYQPLPPNWVITLLIDTRERFKDNEYLFNYFQNQGVRIRKVNLPISDIIWLVHDPSETEHNKMIVLNLCIERKNISDLSHSIKDGRYHEQKMRLKLSGITRIIYLIEGDPTLNSSLPLSSLLTAFVKTECQDGFLIYLVKDSHQTLHFILLVNKLINQEVLSLGIPRVNLSEDNYLTFCQKNEKKSYMTPTLLMSQQLRMIKGLSLSAIHSIVQTYPSFSTLYSTYQQMNTPQEAQLMFYKFKVHNGPQISKDMSFKIWQFFCASQYAF